MNVKRYKAVYTFFYYLFWPFFNLFHPQKPIHAERVPEGAALLCPNHTQACDPFLVAFAVKLKNRPQVMAKEELMHLPFLGWLMKNAGVFGVGRGKADMSAIKRSIKALKEGEKLLVFPEGTRSKDGTIGEGKSGVSMIAIHAGVPIVPIYMPPKKKWFRRTPVVFGEPYVPTVAGKRGTSEEYDAIAKDLMARIAALEAEAK